MISQKVLPMIGLERFLTWTSTTLANPASVFCLQNSGTSEIVTDLTGWQSWVCHLLDWTTCDERAYFRGECPTTWTDLTGTELTGTVETWWLMDQVNQTTNSNSNYFATIMDRDKIECGHKIWNINELVSNIASQKWLIKTITIQQECWWTRILYNKDEYLKLNPNIDDIKKSQNINSENEKYIVYSLVDPTRDIPSMEYPIIVYNKQNQNNSLLTIRSEFPIIWTITNEWIIKIKDFYNISNWTFDLITNSSIKE